MTYVDGFVTPVAAGDREVYRAYAQKVSPVFIEYGALQLVDCWGDDVPHGKVTDFYKAVNATETENVVFSWVVWPSKAVRDEAYPKIMNDPRAMPNADMPFDGKRLIWGGFDVISDVS